MGGASLLPGANGAPASPFHGLATRRFGEDRCCRFRRATRPEVSFGCGFLRAVLFGGGGGVFEFFRLFRCKQCRYSFTRSPGLTTGRSQKPLLGSDRRHASLAFEPGWVKMGPNRLGSTKGGFGRKMEQHGQYCIYEHDMDMLGYGHGSGSGHFLFQSRTINHVSRFWPFSLG